MSSFKIELKGLDKVKGEIKAIPKNAETEIKGQLKAFGINTVEMAKRFAPTDEGHLRNSISYKLEGTTVEVIVAANYAAYVEFGTRKFAETYVATLSQEWQTFASEFKGGGGNAGGLYEFFLRILEWIKRKGIKPDSAEYKYSSKIKDGKLTTRKTRLGTREQKFEQDLKMAEGIAFKILRDGVRAHPFLHPAVEANKEILIKNLNNLFK